MDKLKKKITSAFKLSGFVIRSENSAYLAEQLLPFAASEHDKWLTTVIENIQNLKITSPNIDREIIDKAIVEINRVGLQEHETVFDVIDAFKAPRFVYNLQSKKFVHDKRPRSLMPDVSMQIEYLQQRYYMLHQKTIRHELFSPTIIEKAGGQKKFKLLYVENLLASTEVKEAVIMGQLNSIVEGKLFIEDPTGFVEVDLSEARYHAGFFCEGMFVLAEGSYENNIFKVDGLGFPPAEPATSSRAFFGTANTWGGPSERLLKYSVALQEIERTNTDATMVFLSDVSLDVPEVIQKLRQLFLGYDSCPPICIVLMGPFSNTSVNYYHSRPYFKQLAEAARGCDQLKKQTDLILIPHIYDPIESGIFPRHSLPPVLCKDLLDAWPRTKLMTNPCRLQYCTQQIVVLRHNILARLARNTIHFPDKKDVDHHLARTLICQGHMMPLTKFKNPVYWDYDSSLWLYPLPDLLVIGDNCQSFTTTQHGCTVVNTGSFSKSKFTFKMYIPATRTVEDSEIPDGYEDDDDRKSEDEVIEEIDLVEQEAATENSGDNLNKGIVADDLEVSDLEENAPEEDAPEEDAPEEDAPEEDAAEEDILEEDILEEDIPDEDEVPQQEEEVFVDTSIPKPVVDVDDVIQLSGSGLVKKPKKVTAEDVGLVFKVKPPDVIDIEDVIRPSAPRRRGKIPEIDGINYDDDKPGTSGLNNTSRPLTSEEQDKPAVSRASKPLTEDELLQIQLMENLELDSDTSDEF